MAQSALGVVQEHMSEVVRLLTDGDAEGGARRFVETIAFGPGAWKELPQATRETFVFNAPTWLDEFRDPEALEIDLEQLTDFSAPALLTVGGTSPGFFSLVVERVAKVLNHIERHEFVDAGHVPHMSHPDEYVDVVTRFAESSAT
jgi:pimeloyl-ACP methyl ester carboxylesterase